MGFNRTLYWSEQLAWRKNHITGTLQRTHEYWSHPTHDYVDKLCDPDKVIRWSEPVADVHWYTCQMSTDTHT